MFIAGRRVRLSAQARMRSVNSRASNSTGERPCRLIRTAEQRAACADSSRLCAGRTRSWTPWPLYPETGDESQNPQPSAEVQGPARGLTRWRAPKFPEILTYEGRPGVYRLRSHPPLPETDMSNSKPRQFTPKDSARIQSFVDRQPAPTPRQEKFKADVMRRVAKRQKK